MSLLFKESPYIGAVAILLPVITYTQSSINIYFALTLLPILFLLYFYRYTPYTNVHDINEVISPCEGSITKIIDKYDYYYISIFLSPLNKHWQIYPATGRVIHRDYDHTGTFNIVTTVDKSRDNEKKIHYLLMPNKAVIKITQIAGFLPRMITSSDKVPLEVEAGDYLGMIKFGSRVELMIPKKTQTNEIFNLADNIYENATICIGDAIGKYE